MIVIDNKKHGIHFYNVWFADKPIGKPGVIQYHQAKFNQKGFIAFETIINDIQNDDELILSTFSKGCRYKVNRGKREDIELEFYTGVEIQDELIDRFVEFFKEFWISKGTILREPDKLKKALFDYRSNNALSITCASLNGNTIVYHVYIMDDKRVRLLHSASLYRAEDDSDSKFKNLIGIANRYLHYEEMLYYRDKGIYQYDWGGAGRGEDVISITEFKESFGGYLESSFDGEMYVGIKAKLFRFLAKVIKG